MDSANTTSSVTIKRSVFVSHASKNFKIADEVRALLEERGISCWIAPRDIPPGGKYGTAIVDAIADCTVVVLLLTDEANQSSAVENEIERAFGNQKTIIPIRLRDIKPSKGLEFFVSNAQWVDAFVSPLKGRIEQIVNIVHAIELDKPAPAVQPEVPTLLGRAERQLERALRHKVLSASVAFGILALLSGAILTVQMSSQERLNTVTTSISKSADRIDGAATTIEQSSTTIKSMDAKLDGVKKETSDDPRKELANLGAPWDEANFAANLHDERLRTLYQRAGMKVNITILALLETRQISADSARFLVTHPELVACDTGRIGQNYTFYFGLSQYRNLAVVDVINKVCNKDMAVVKALTAEAQKLEDKLNRTSGAGDRAREQVKIDWIKDAISLLGGRP